MTILLDSAVCILLLLTILYCIKLNQKISSLRQGKQEFLALFRQFDDAILRAEKNIADMKKLTETTAGELHYQIKEAKALLDDLEYATGRASHTLQAANNQNKVGKLEEYTSIFPQNREAQLREKNASPLNNSRSALVNHDVTTRELDDSRRMLLNKSPAKKEEVLKTLMERIAQPGRKPVSEEQAKKDIMDALRSVKSELV